MAPQAGVRGDVQGAEHGQDQGRRGAFSVLLFASLSPACAMLITARGSRLYASADPAAVPALPVERGRAPERPARLLGRAPQPGPEQDGDDHAFALRPQHLGQRRAGLAQAQRQVHVLREREQPRLPVEWHDSPLTYSCKPSAMMHLRCRPSSSTSYRYRTSPKRRRDGHCI